MVIRCSVFPGVLTPVAMVIYRKAPHYILTTHMRCISPTSSTIQFTDSGFCKISAKFLHAKYISSSLVSSIFTLLPPPRPPRSVLRLVNVPRRVDIKALELQFDKSRLYLVKDFVTDSQPPVFSRAKTGTHFYACSCIGTVKRGARWMRFQQLR